MPVLIIWVRCINPSMAPDEPVDSYRVQRFKSLLKIWVKCVIIRH